MAVINSLLFIVGAIILFWVLGYAHELVYAKFKKKSIPRNKKGQMPMVVRGYIWGMWYMVVALFFYK